MIVGNSKMLPLLGIKFGIAPAGKAGINQQDYADVKLVADDPAGCLEDLVKSRQLVGVLETIIVLAGEEIAQLVGFRIEPREANTDNCYSD